MKKDVLLINYINLLVFKYNIFYFNLFGCYLKHNGIFLLLLIIIKLNLLLLLLLLFLQYIK